jgi:ribosomal protein L37AE/L43A
MAHSIEWFVTAFVATGLLGFFACWLYYDRRDRHHYDWQRQRRVYHCVKCGNLYMQRGHGDLMQCPSCGMQNSSLRF